MNFQVLVIKLLVQLVRCHYNAMNNGHLLDEVRVVKEAKKFIEEEERKTFPDSNC